MKKRTRREMTLLELRTVAPDLADLMDEGVIKSMSEARAVLRVRDDERFREERLRELMNPPPKPPTYYDKPSSELLADARFVLYWCGEEVAKSVIEDHGYPLHMALEDAKSIEQATINFAEKFGISVDDVRMLKQVPEADRKIVLAILLINRKIAAGRMEPPTGWLEALEKENERRRDELDTKIHLLERVK